MFIPEVLLSARTMQACLDASEPQLTAAHRHSFATVVLATVEGDVHDIDTSVSASAFPEAVKKHDAVMVGMSALLRAGQALDVGTNGHVTQRSRKAQPIGGCQ